MKFKNGVPNISAAINEASRLVRQEKQKNSIVILLTDGQTDDFEKAVDAANSFNLLRKTARKNMFFFTLGIGQYYDKALL